MKTGSVFAADPRQAILVSSFTEISQFQGLVGNFIEMVDSLAQQVNKEKIKVCGVVANGCYRPASSGYAILT